MLLVVLLCTPSTALRAAEDAFGPGVEAYDAHRYEQAFEAWRPLAESGHRAAQFNLAHLYENGLGTPRDLAQAARWYRAAAEQGDSDAARRIGAMYEAGSGVDADPLQAAFWYGRAAADPKADPATRKELAAALERVRGLAQSQQEGNVIPYPGGRFVIAMRPPSDCVVALQGEITREASGGFERVIRKAAALGCASPVSLLLESPGGSHLDGLRLGRKVHAQRLRTVVRYACASACASIFLGGSERVLWGNRAAVGLHEIAESWFAGDPHARCIDARDVRDARALEEYLHDVNPEHAQQLFDIAMSTSCKSIEWLHGRRALDLGVATRLEAEGLDVFGPEAARRPTP